MNQLQRPADLQLLNVFGEVAARHALVHMLVARERVELLDAGLDVVAQHPFARGDRRQVDVVEHPLVVGRPRRSGTSTPNSACARSTASHSRRSATTLASGDQIATISSLAYRLASTLGIVTDTQLTARVRQARPMYFVGLDLAWGEKSHTGVAAVDSDGRLLHVGVAQDDASIDGRGRPRSSTTSAWSPSMRR